MLDNNVYEWIKVAYFDSDTVDILIREKGHSEVIIYHIHQAIEKFLKALMIKSNKKVEKVHALDRLLAELINIYTSLNDIKNDILEINLYLPKLRYPYGDIIEFSETEKLYEKFNIIKKILLKLLEE